MEEKAAQGESKMMAAEKQEQDSSGAGEESVSKGVFIQEGRSRRAGQLLQDSVLSPSTGTAITGR
jgi:hypothetical protein